MFFSLAIFNVKKTPSYIAAYLASVFIVVTDNFSCLASRLFHEVCLFALESSQARKRRRRFMYICVKRQSTFTLQGTCTDSYIIFVVT